MTPRLVLAILLWTSCGGVAYATWQVPVVAISSLVVATLATIPIVILQSSGPPSQAILARRAKADELAKTKRLAKAKATTEKEQKKEAGKAAKKGKASKKTEAVPPTPKAAKVKKASAKK